MKFFKINGTKNKNLSLLHCTSAYPTPEKETNLKTILYLKKKYKIKVGFSDHTIGIDASVASVAMGAEIIEKHFTLNNKMKGQDHKTKEPNELKKMVEKSELLKKMLGREKKIITPNEKKKYSICRKSIVAKKNIKKGEKFTIENITTKRPAKKGVSPMNFYNLIGKNLRKNF